MRQTQIENMLYDLDKRIKVLESMNVIGTTEIKDIKTEEKLIDTPKEKYKESVESKGLPITKEGVSTTESGDGKSPLENVKKVKKNG